MQKRLELMHDNGISGTTFSERVYGSRSEPASSKRRRLTAKRSTFDMIMEKNDASRNLEKALQALDAQAYFYT